MTCTGYWHHFRAFRRFQTLTQHKTRH